MPRSHGDIVNQTVFDHDGDHYLLMIFGKDGQRRIHGCLLHLDIADGQMLI